MKLEQDHPLTNPEIYPEKRHLSAGEREEAERLINLGVTVRALHTHLSQISGKPLILKDVHNLRAQTKFRNKNGKDEQQLLLDEVEQLLQSDSGARVQLVTKDDGSLKILYFQNSSMTSLYSTFPEVLLLDATYCVNNLRMPLFVFICIDGNGEGGVVGYAIVSDVTQ